MVGWHHQLNGHELEQTPGESDGQGGLECCSPWGCRHDLATEQEGFSPQGRRVDLVKARLSCCISLCVLFDEPMEGKARAGKLEENSRSNRNCRHTVFSPLVVDPADTDIMQPQRSHKVTSRWSLYVLTEQN